jgi:hypothetical protein
MLAIHWSPVKNTKNILKNGISKSKTGLYCFPLTGDYSMDKWWVSILRSGRKQYNGFVFKIENGDLPAVFEDWIGHTTQDTFKMEINSLEELKPRYRERMVSKFGQNIVGQKYYKTLEILLSNKEYEAMDEFFLEKGNAEIHSKKELFYDKDFLRNAFKHWQIILSRSINPNRIMKIISNRNEYGRILYKNKKNNLIKNDDNDY